MNIKIHPDHIEQWVKKHFPDYIKKSDEYIVISNPFYGNDKKKFNISLTKGFCHDWRDDTWAHPVNPKTGKLNRSFIKFVKLYRKCSYDQAIREVLGSSASIKQYYRPELISESDNALVVDVQLPQHAASLSLEDTKLTKVIKNYLISRGYTDQSIKDKMLMYEGTDVVWPYFEYEELVYWQSRSVLNKRFKFPDKEKYENGVLIGKNNKGKADYLYGFDDVKLGKYLIITEAIFCQNTLGDQCVASGGALLSSTQISKMKLLSPNSVILAADNDHAGIKSIVQNSKMLKNAGFKVFYSICPADEECKDWNDLFTIRKMSHQDIRKVFEDNIKPYNISSMYNLLKIKKSRQ
jgi:hypothetical protein